MAIEDLPFGKFLATKKKLSVYDQNEMEKKYQKYRNSIGVLHGLACTDCFTNFEKARLSKAEDFTNLKAPDGTPFVDKLKSNSPEATDVKDKWQKALEFDKKTNRAKRNFDIAIKELNTLILTDPPQFDIAAIAENAQIARTNAGNALRAQFTTEETALTNLFKDPTFVNNLKTTMGPDTAQADIDNLQKEMLVELKKSQEEGFKKFDKVIDDEVKKLHRSAQGERDQYQGTDLERRRIGFLGRISDDNEFMNNEKNRRAIHEAFLRNKGAAAGQAVSLTMNRKGATFKGVAVGDLEYIQSLSGKKLRNTKDVNDPNSKAPASFILDLYNIDPLYYQSRHANLDYDLTTMAMAARADGFEQMNFTIDFPDDPEFALELGRKAYEAALGAGFSPPDPEKPKASNIIINVNGEAKTIDDLFKGQQARKEAALSNFAKEEQKRKAYENSPKIKSDTATIKQDLQKMQDDARTEEEKTEDKTAGIAAP